MILQQLTLTPAILGAWAGRAEFAGDDRPEVAARTCQSYKKNPKAVTGDLLVFAGKSKRSYGGYTDYTDTNVSVKQTGPNAWRITDRHFDDGETGRRPGYRNVTYDVMIEGDILTVTETGSNTRYSRCGMQPATAATSPAPRACLRADDALTGAVQLVRTKHNSGTSVEIYQLVSLKETCVQDEFCPDGKSAKYFGLLATDETKKILESRVGEVITIRARHYFCPQTQWHVGDAMASEIHIAP